MAVASPPSPPNYDNIRWAGKQTPRIPVEIGGGTIYLTSLKQIDRGSGSTTATFNLVPYERDTLGAAEASMIEVDNAGSGTGATVLVLPGAFPGHIYIVYNNTGQGQTVTLKVTGRLALLWLLEHLLCSSVVSRTSSESVLTLSLVVVQRLYLQPM